MTAKKFLIPFILASLAGHALLLALTARIDMAGGPRAEKVMTVELKAPREAATKEESSRRQEAPPSRLQAAAGIREDSASLGSRNGPYDSYLINIRRKIEEIWNYPPEAISRKAEGNAIIRFTITASGKLAECRIVETSGNPVLDRGALTVVRAAAPYTPLPAAFNLSRLHITATFSYRLGE
ncbi:MAG: energy transducer TonB [Proteobacteria bacterium]|nr:energy transducer TonB [Pseudomonadota bacterium]MBU2260322.1 energy transducer TonB [Pseudomonadota bacterium]